jgi:hypothetical protein
MAWRYDFECPECSATFELSGWRVIFALHMIGRGVQVDCPSCHHANWMLPHRVQ